VFRLLYSIHRERRRKLTYTNNEQVSIIVNSFGWSFHATRKEKFEEIFDFTGGAEREHLHF
jgi:hypothetical protein